MYCSKCGNLIAEDMQFCPKCGAAIKNVMGNTKRERHGFTTFCLLLWTIGSGIFGLSFIFSSDAWIKIYYNLGIRFTSSVSFLNGLLSVIAAIGSILLLSWRKFGFWLILVALIIQPFLLASIGMNFFLALFNSAIGVLMTWGVLHIRKNGYSAWEHLNGNNRNNYSSDSYSLKLSGIAPLTSKKCKRCGKTVDSGYTGCPHCGCTELF
jgi:RNA polymerase subunit RPABC4/transcription elongation factor Spt4